MIEIKNFDNWIEDTNSGKFGSGASEKVWLINPETNEKGIFKFPKIKHNGEITGEYWAEKLATEIGELIGVECAKVDIGIYKGRIGSMSYNINLSNNYSFIEGIEFIQSKYPYYDKDILQDTYTGNKYSIQMINNSIKGILKIEEILNMTIFDILIGNSDRHHSNWGIKYKVFNDEYDNTFEIYDGLCPLYDNGSSLCAYEDDKNTEIFFKDKMKFEALINTKSKSSIGWKDKRPIRQFELLKNIKEDYYSLTIDFVEVILEEISEKRINDILNKFSDNIINENMKKLIKVFILERRKRILDIYELKEEV